MRWELYCHAELLNSKDIAEVKTRYQDDYTYEYRRISFHTDVLNL